MSQKVNLTPLAGGKNDLAGICSILEIGPFTILLDCGCSTKNSFELLQKIKKYLSNIGKSIDAVILSHADLQHMGALPVVFNKKMGGLLNTNVICTLPVHKFGQLVLYDYCANTEMEGQVEQQPAGGDKSKKVLNYDYDDIDQALLNPTVVKFSQLIELKPSSSYSLNTSTLSVCAYPSGRTIGGAIWRIRLGSTEILYAVDINMKNEIVLSGANIDQLPSTPSLLITDACTSYQLTAVKSKIETWQHSINQTKPSLTTGNKKKKDATKDDPNGLISTVLDTLRNNGNVLIPCETAGRSLELIQILATHWTNHKIGLYHLIFLSPMAENVVEFAKSQLEWMSEQLSKKFYNGSRNPFEFNLLKVCTSIHELERLYPGPKVVLTSDASMTCGLSKELILLWGGDPRCNVIFTDISDQNSLAYELRSQLPPIVVSVTRPVRVELSGEELIAYKEQEEKKRKENQETENQRKRQEELELLALAGEEDEEDEETDNDDTSSMMLQTPPVKRQHSLDSNTSQLSGGTTSVVKRRKVLHHSDLLLKFAQPSFPMFESKGVEFTYDEFGCGNEDLVFRDIDPSAKYNTLSRVSQATSSLPASTATQPGADDSDPKNAAKATKGREQPNKTGQLTKATHNTTTETQLVEIPTKVISTTIKVQFTCTVSEIPIAGRADIKVAKYIISKLTPIRMVVLRGSTHDCDALVSHAKSSFIHAVSPSNGETINFSIEIDRIKLQIPISLFPSTERWQKVSGLNYSMKDTVCSLANLQGAVMEIATKDQSGLRTLRLLPLPPVTLTSPSATPAVTASKKSKKVRKAAKMEEKTATNTSTTAVTAAATVDHSAADTATTATQNTQVKSEPEPVAAAATKKGAASKTKAATKRGKGKTATATAATDMETEEEEVEETTAGKTDGVTSTISEGVSSTAGSSTFEAAAIKIKLEQGQGEGTAVSAIGLDTTAASATVATSGGDLAAAAAIDTSSLDVDAFFNSMASQLMADSSTAVPAATTTTAAGSGASGNVLSSAYQPASSGSIPSMHPPLQPVIVTYPDQFNDYEGLLPADTAGSASGVSALLSGVSGGVDDFQDEDVVDDHTKPVSVKHTITPTTEDDIEETEEDDEEDDEETQIQLKQNRESSIAISVGEISLNNIKVALEKLGFQVEFKMTSQGASLICENQIIISRKVETSSSQNSISELSNSNNFVVEGLPIPAFWETKKLLREKFAFI